MTSAASVEPRRGLELALGVDDLRAALALGLGLARHRVLHALGDLDVLDLDGRDLHAPGLGLVVDDLLQVLVEALALGQQRVELGLAEHRAQRRLRDLRGRGQHVLDLDDRPGRVDDAEVGDRGDARGHVVAGDDVLRRDLQRDRAQAHADHAVDAGQQQDQARPALARSPARAGRRRRARTRAARAPRRRQHERGGDEAQTTRTSATIMRSAPTRRRGGRESVSPLTRSTTTGSPSCERLVVARRPVCRARHSAPSTNTWPAGSLPAAHDADAPAQPLARRRDARAARRPRLARHQQRPAAGRRGPGRHRPARRAPRRRPARR